MSVIKCCIIEWGVSKTMEYFKSCRLNVNSTKIDFLLLNKPATNPFLENKSIDVPNQTNEVSCNTKNSCVILDKSLTFQEDIKSCLRKMACGIKTINSIKNCLPLSTRFFLVEAVVINHVHYPAVLLNGLRIYYLDGPT